MSYEDLFIVDGNKDIFEVCDVSTPLTEGLLSATEKSEEITDVFVGLDVDCRSELSSLSDSDSKNSEPPEKPARKQLVIGKHIKINDGELQKFTCTICNCSFSRKQQVRYHDYCVTGKRPLKCDLCGKGFVKKSHLVYHIRTHTGESPFKCSICQKSFKQKAKLNRHEKTHETESRMLCIYCKKSYSDKDSLRKHEQKHSEKVFNCTTCKKSYTDKFSLKQHLEIHKSPNYICDVCGKAFLRKNSLNVHKQIHEDIYPYECENCHRTFRSRKELNHHNIVHDKNNPGHECEICNITCGRRDNLLRHIRNCHLDPCQKKSKKELKDNCNIQQNSQQDSLDKSNPEDKSLHSKKNIEETNKNKIHETDNNKNNSINRKSKIGSKNGNSQYSSKLIVKLFPSQNDTNHPSKLSKKLNYGKNESKHLNDNKKFKKNINFFSLNREKKCKTNIKESVGENLKDPEERSVTVETGQPSEDCNVPLSEKQFQCKSLVSSEQSTSSPEVGKSKDESNSVPSSPQHTKVKESYNLIHPLAKSCEFEEHNFPRGNGYLLRNSIQTTRDPLPGTPSPLGGIQKTSVIMHTDLYKASLLAANSLREPVIKSLTLPTLPTTSPHQTLDSKETH